MNFLDNILIFNYIRQLKVEKLETLELVTKVSNVNVTIVIEEFAMVEAVFVVVDTSAEGVAAVSPVPVIVTVLGMVVDVVYIVVVAFVVGNDVDGGAKVVVVAVDREDGGGSGFL